MKLEESIPEHSAYLSPLRFFFFFSLMQRRLSSPTSRGGVIQSRKRTMIYGGNYSHYCKPK